MEQSQGGTIQKLFTSNNIRNFVADTMLTRGLSMNKTSKLMNHASVSATRHYVNKFHAGPTMLNDEDDDDSNDNEEENLIGFI